MPMDEDAAFKVLLKNKSQQAAQGGQKTPPPARPSPAPKSTGSKSEDDLYKALLKNRPQQPVQVPPARAEPRPAPPAQVPHARAPAPVQPEYREPEPVIEPKISPAVSETQVASMAPSIKALADSVNQMQSLIKTVFYVLILTLLVGIVILVRLK